MFKAHLIYFLLYYLQILDPLTQISVHSQGRAQRLVQWAYRNCFLSYIWILGTKDKIIGCMNSLQ